MLKDLNGPWKVTHVDYREDIFRMLQPTFQPEGFLDAAIPEDVHATLRRAGAIRGNTYNKRENEEAWIEERDWVYYKAFYVPETFENRRARLIFEGLDTFCELYLNGRLIGTHSNMHTPCIVDVTGLLLPRKLNRLLVRFFSPVRYVSGRDESNIFSITTSDRIFARKAQMNYSWDFCARCVTVGIWKSVRLETVENVQIQDYYVYTDQLDARSAKVMVQVNLDEETLAFAQADTVIGVSLSWQGQTVAEASIPLAKQVTAALTVDDPKLWWPRPYGDQPLYDFSVKLIRKGVTLSEKKQRLGLRTLRVLQEKQPDGLSFQFCVNGRKLFIRGANWVPLNTVYTDIQPSDYDEMIHYAVHGNLSMLRIWGGGIYENPALFEACDRAGILIWNDFMLACGIYPHDEAFLQEMRQEAEHVLTTYRNYTCLALWSGDNENGQAYIWAGREYEYYQDPINHCVLKEACQRLDPQRFFLPTSPGSPNPDVRGGDNQESPYQGDMHVYIMSADPGKTTGRDYGRDYYKRIRGYHPRFISEFGFISLPEKDSYYRFNTHHEPLRNPSEIIKFLPFTKAYLDDGNIDAVIYYSQVFNASALKYWIEHFRRLKGACSGTLYWKFNDPLADCPDVWMYPSHMCSVDMYHKPKMTYYYTRRAYADTIISFEEKMNGDLAIWLTSESLLQQQGTVKVRRASFSGEVLCAQEYQVVLPADCSMQVCVLDDSLTQPVDRFGEYLWCEWHSETADCDNLYLFADLNEMNRLKLPEGSVATTAQWDGSSILLQITAHTFIRNMRLHILDQRADYEDNYFNLPANSTKTVRISFPDHENLLDRTLYLEAENISRIVLPLAEI